jgi:redox-sensing transcriptional repressor
MTAIPQPSRERLLSLLRVLENRGGTLADPDRPAAPESAVPPVEDKDSLPLTLTSAQIEALSGWPRETIRKDISFLKDFGDLGASSAGYDPAVLVPAIRRSLGLDRRRRVCVVGLGRLGSAYLNYSAFEMEEFELIAGFDSSVNRVDILKSPVPLYPAYKMGEVIGRFAIEIALLCVPAQAAQAAAEKLAAAGIRGIINFAPLVLQVPQEVAVRNIYLTDALRELIIRIK